jgi:hypothetical protein
MDSQIVISKKILHTNFDSETSSMMLYATQLKHSAKKSIRFIDFDDLEFGAKIGTKK